MNRFINRTLVVAGVATVIIGCGNNDKEYCTEVIDGIEWTYTIEDGGAVLGTRERGAVSNSVQGSLIIPSKIGGQNVTKINDRAFARCESLTSVTVPNGVTDIGNAAFDHCTALKKIEIPSSVVRIGSWAFDETPFYEHFPDGFVVIGTILYRYKGKCPTNIVIPDGITGVSARAFAFTCIKSIKIPDSVSNIDIPVITCRGDSMTIEVGERNRSYKSERGLLLTKDGKKLVLSACGSEEIPDGVEIIGDNAFAMCESIRTVRIPDGITAIGKEAFLGCKNMTSITIPKSVVNIGKYAFAASGLKSISVDAGNSIYKSENGLLLTKDGKVLISGVNGEVVIPDGVKRIADSSFGSCRGLVSVSIPVSVTCIGEEAFSNCSSLKSLSLPSGVREIGGMAFRDCTSLESLTLPSGVREIGGMAFCHCSSLESLTLPSGVREIGEGAFEACDKLRALVIPDGIAKINDHMFWMCGSLEFVQIPQSVRSIGAGTFSMCESLGSIAIPKGVKTIESGAFYGCKSLTALTLPSSVSSIDGRAFEGCKKLSFLYVEDGDEDRVRKLLRGAGYETVRFKFMKIEDLSEEVKKSIGY